MQPKDNHGLAAVLADQPESAPYWQACSSGKLLVKKCGDCGRSHHYPRVHCPHCFSPNTSWIESAGRGHIYTFSVMRRAEVPYAVGYVMLEEGCAMMTNFVDCDLDLLRVGQTVQVRFRRCDEGFDVPVFKPVAA